MSLLSVKFFPSKEVKQLHPKKRLGGTSDFLKIGFVFISVQK
jgi:hypothetical protein